MSELTEISYASRFKFKDSTAWFDYVNGFKTVDQAIESANEMRSKYPDAIVCVSKRKDEIVVDMKALIRGEKK